MDQLNQAKIVASINESIATKRRLLKNEPAMRTLERMAHWIGEAYDRGGKLLIAGNGGSAADAQHFAAEITCQFMLKRKARAALALHTDTSALTAWGNDHSFESAYARQVEAHGREGDVLILISTSGNSENLIQAAHTARDRGIDVFAFLGKGGGKLYENDLCDEALIVPSTETPRIQECHIMCIHIVCEYLDELFAKRDATA